ncbi:MAG: Ig-like domain-containing protein [Micrococcales bacterium]|nr:Ig-like domain-containing protein [Micrococcales bacterium]
MSGTATAGDTVTVKDATGQPVAGCENVPVDSTGHFQCAPSTRVQPGNSLTVVDVNAAGLSSEPATVTVSALRLAIGLAGVTVGQSQTVTGYNFNPGEKVDLTLQSTPVDMGTQTADASGTVVFTVTVPQTLAIGTHTATLTGAQSGSVADTFQVTLLVQTGGGVVVPTSPAIALGVGVAYVGRKDEEDEQ